MHAKRLCIYYHTVSLPTSLILDRLMRIVCINITPWLSPKTFLNFSFDSVLILRLTWISKDIIVYHFVYMKIVYFYGLLFLCRLLIVQVFNAIIMPVASKWFLIISFNETFLNIKNRNNKWSIFFLIC